MTEFVDLGGDAFFLKKSGALIDFSGDTRRGTGGGYSSSATAADRTKWVNWYSPDNDFPATALELFTSNNILHGILSTKVEFLLGQGIVLFEEDLDPATGKRSVRFVQDAAVEQFFEENNVAELMHRRAIDRAVFGVDFIEMLLNDEGRVYSVKHLDAMTVRSGWKNLRTGRVENYFVCPDWKNPKYDPSARGEARKDNNVRRVPAFDPTNPTRYEKCILATKSYMPGHPYYPLPDWWATSEWIRLAVKIPKWHSSGIDNGYSIRYHVKIPRSWLEQFPADQREAQKMRVREEMDDFLSGAKNAGKAFFSTFSNTGSLPDGWEILPIDSKLSDEAYTALFAQSNIAVVSGLGMDPTLAGVQMEGGLGNASEKRIAYGIHMALKTPRPRAELLAALHIFKKMNGWNPRLKFGFRDIELTTLDEAPTGQKAVVQ
ncbi:MAG: hypothetical protein ACK4Q5_06005 [Saprospiraceae bacterium]